MIEALARQPHQWIKCWHGAENHKAYIGILSASRGDNARVELRTRYDGRPAVTTISPTAGSVNSQSAWTESAGTAAARSALAGFAARSDLVREFLAAPFGRHSAELHLILDVMRSQPIAGKWIAIMTKPYSEWRAARWSLDMPLRVAEIAPPRFESREDVERWVFKQRWQHLFGALPMPEDGDDV
ncbi:hypothetical protein [Mesorhizobium sp. M0047]|uniref:hypothetical protein n=1 Tax=Mesorhizobium sp. M0047 TaxID=2956859 RepID=UPI0033392A0E